MIQIQEFKLMSDVMKAMSKMEDRKERQELTQIFNENDLIHKFIRIYLRFLAENKYKEKYYILKHIRNSYKSINSHIKISPNFGENIDVAFLKILKLKNDLNYSQEQLAYSLY